MYFQVLGCYAVDLIHVNTPFLASFDVGVVGHTSPLLAELPLFFDSRRMMLTADIAFITACGKMKAQKL